MKIKILDTKENPLLKRKEIIGLIEHGGEATPSKAAVQAYLSKTEKFKPKHVEVKKIFSPVGGINSKFLVYLWKEKEVPILEEKKPEEKTEESKKDEPKEKSEETKEAPKEEPKKDDKEESKEEKPKEDKKDDKKKKEKGE